MTGRIVWRYLRPLGMLQAVRLSWLLRSLAGMAALTGVVGSACAKDAPASVLQADDLVPIDGASFDRNAIVESSACPLASPMPPATVAPPRSAPSSPRDQITAVAGLASVYGLCQYHGGMFAQAVPLLADSDPNCASGDMPAVGALWGRKPPRSCRAGTVPCGARPGRLRQPRDRS